MGWRYLVGGCPPQAFSGLLAWEQVLANAGSLEASVSQAVLTPRFLLGQKPYRVCMLGTQLMELVFSKIFGTMQCGYCEFHGSSQRENLVCDEPKGCPIIAF